MSSTEFTQMSEEAKLGIMIRIAKHVALALAHVHGHGFIHNDVALRNILVCINLFGLFFTFSFSSSFLHNFSYFFCFCKVQLRLHAFSFSFLHNFTYFFFFQLDHTRTAKLGDFGLATATTAGKNKEKNKLLPLAHAAPEVTKKKMGIL